MQSIAREVKNASGQHRETPVLACRPVRSARILRLKRSAIMRTPARTAAHLAVNARLFVQSIAELITHDPRVVNDFSANDCAILLQSAKIGQ
jgi:hypothetical protein